MTPNLLAHELRFGTLDSVLKVLTESNIDPNTCGVFHLSKVDFEAKLDALLEHGWDIDRCSLLHDAKHGFGQRVELYLRRGANPTSSMPMGKVLCTNLPV